MGKKKDESAGKKRRAGSTTSLGKRRSRTKSPGQRQSSVASKQTANSGVDRATSTMSNPRSSEYGSQASPLRVPTHPKELIKVTIVGAAGGIGQPLAMLLMMHSEYVHHLALYDLVDSLPGVGLDLSHIDRQVKVTTHTGPETLAEAVKGASVIIVLAGLAQKPGMSRDDLFGSNAHIMYNIAKCCAQTAPDAMLCIVTNPVNSLVPLACEVYSRVCCGRSPQQPHQPPQSAPKSKSPTQSQPQSQPQSQSQQQPHQHKQQQQPQQQKHPSPERHQKKPTSPGQHQKQEQPQQQQQQQQRPPESQAGAQHAGKSDAGGGSHHTAEAAKSAVAESKASAASKPAEPSNNTSTKSLQSLGACSRQSTGHFEDCFRRIFGVTTLDVVRASTLTAKSTFFKTEPSGLFKDPGKIQVPVVGGHAGKTIMPLLSQAHPKLDRKQLQDEKTSTLTLIESIQQAGIDVLNAKKGKGSATLAMAYAACRFTVSLLRAKAGEKNIVECAYVRHSSPCCHDLEYFAAPMLLGKNGYVKTTATYLPSGSVSSLMSAGGSQASGSGASGASGTSGAAAAPSSPSSSTAAAASSNKLLPFEMHMLEEGCRELRLSIAKGEDFAREQLLADK
jgi:malate/lactate dehydrogenase